MKLNHQLKLCNIKYKGVPVVSYDKIAVLMLVLFRCM